MTEQGITDAQLQSEIDRLDKQLKDLNPGSTEYDAASQIKNALEGVVQAKSYREDALQPPHPDTEFLKTIHEATEDHGHGDYGVTDLEIGEDFTLRSTYRGGCIFKNGETIVEFESPYTEFGGVDHPIKVTGQVSLEQKEFILNQVKEIEQGRGLEQPTIDDTSLSVQDKHFFDPAQSPAHDRGTLGQNDILAESLTAVATQTIPDRGTEPDDRELAEGDAALDLQTGLEPGSQGDVVDAARYIVKEMGESDYAGGKSFESDEFTIEINGYDIKVLDQEGNMAIEIDESGGVDSYQPSPELVDILTSTADELEQQEMERGDSERVVDEGWEVGD